MPEAARQLQGQARLADAAQPGERDQPDRLAREERSERGHIALPADQRAAQYR